MKSLFKILVFSMVALVVSSFTGAAMTGSAIGLAVASYFIPSVQSSALMAIPIQDARNVFTKMIVAVYKEQVSVTSFLRSFFPTVEKMSKEISIEVQRGLEKVAVDVERGTNGNRNTFSKSTEKTFVPPFYWEYLTANEHRLYDIAIGMQNENAFTQLTAELAEDLFKLQQKIERAYELQCAQVLETGIVQLNAGVNIDFKRKALSLVDLGSGNYWTTGTNSPYVTLETGAKFIRQVGKSQGTIYNVLMGSEAYEAFESNTIVQNRADVRNFNMDAISEPQRNSVGGTYQGMVASGSFKFRIWTYPEFYDDATNTSTPYLNPKKIIILPESPKFNLVFAAVPQLLDENGNAAQKGAYLVQDFIDTRATAHEMHIKSAGVAVPVAIDQIWTCQVVAS